MSRLESRLGRNIALTAAALGLAASGCQTPLFGGASKESTPLVAGSSQSASDRLLQAMATEQAGITTRISRLEGTPLPVPTRVETPRAGATAAVKAQPETTRRIEQAGELDHDFELKPGQKIELKESDFTGGQLTVVKGDIQVNGFATHDNDPKTGDMIIIGSPATVAAKWGANVTVKLDEANLVDFVKYNTGLMKQRGCEGGCDEVRLMRFDGKTLTRITVDQLGGTTATQKPGKGASVEAKGDACVDVTLKAGDTHTTKAPGFVNGDVIVDGTRLFDDNENTALIVRLNKTGTAINAPYGANFHCFPGEDEQTIAKALGDSIKETQQKGGFARVDIVEWPGGKRQG